MKATFQSLHVLLLLSDGPQRAGEKLYYSHLQKKKAAVNEKFMSLPPPDKHPR